MKKKDAYNQDEFVHDVLDFLVAYYKEIERLNKECDTYMEVATRKARRMREAIEYIEKFIPIDNDTILMRERQRDHLLNILKGDQE